MEIRLGREAFEALPPDVQALLRAASDRETESR